MTADTGSTSKKLEKEIGLGAVTAIGVGGTIGASIFTITGFAAGMAGPSMILAFIIGGLLTILVGLNYSELSSTFPESGGGYTFAKKAYGGLPAFLTGWLMAFSNIVFGSLAALGFAHIFGFAFGIPPLVYIPIALVVVGVFAYLNTRGMEESGKIQLILVLVLITGFLIFIGFSFSKISSSNYSPWMPFGWNGVLKATAFVYVSYFGFETIATVSGEVKKPGKNLVIGTIASLIICMFVYVGVSYVAVGVAGLELADNASPLMLVGEIAMGRSGIILIGVVGGIGTLSSTNTAVIASTRIIYALSRDGLLPKGLARTGEGQNPIYATLTSAILMGIFISTGVVEFIAHVADFNLLLALIFVNMSVFFLRRKRKVLKRPFKTNVIIAIACTIILGGLILFLSSLAISIGVAISMLGVLIYLMKIKPPRTYSLTIGGISTGAGLILLGTLWVGNRSIILQTGNISFQLVNLLAIGGVIQLIGGIICAFPLMKLFKFDMNGVIDTPPSKGKTRSVKIVKNVISILLICFAILNLFIFYTVFHGFVIFPNATDFPEAYGSLLSVALISTAFSTGISGLFLFQRKYISS